MAGSVTTARFLRLEADWCDPQDPLWQHKQDLALAAELAEAEGITRPRPAHQRAGKATAATTASRTRARLAIVARLNATLDPSLSASARAALIARRWPHDPDLPPWSITSIRQALKKLTG